MATIPEALAVAVQHHQSGQLLQAEQIYRQILNADPSHADALHLLGVIASRAGKFPEAIDLIERAITINPRAEAYHCNLGIALRGAGRIDDAIAAYHRALEINPQFAEAYGNLGITLKDQQRFDEAIQAYQRAIEIKPDYAEAHYNRGLTLREQGKLEQAIECYRNAVQVRPNYVRAHTNLGNALHELGRFSEAIECYQQATRISSRTLPTHTTILGSPFAIQACWTKRCSVFAEPSKSSQTTLKRSFNLGNLHRELDQLDEAIACYRQALQVRPDYADAGNNLGNALTERGLYEEAAESFQRALQARPDFADAHNNLGNALKKLGRLDEAVAAHCRALEIKPDFAEAHYNLGNAYKEQRNFDAAVECYQRALEVNPSYADAGNNLGNTFKDQGRLSEAADSYGAALRIDPQFAEAHNNLGNTRKDQGRLDEALACFEKAFELKPDYAAAFNNRLATLSYRSGANLAELSAAHAEFDQQLCQPLRGQWQPHAADRNPDRPLRLGFLSPDLGMHPVGYFLILVLENLPQSEYEVICYSDRARPDALAARIRKASSEWSSVENLSDDQLAQRIRDDKIDILFDLAGHTARNRLLVFARKPAPIQITWMGYVGTTGLQAMDYIIADQHEIPAGCEQHYCERVLRMPDGYLCYDPPEYAPPVTQLPAMDNGWVTFGSFNNPAKITDEIIDVWGQILARVA